MTPLKRGQERKVAPGVYVTSAGSYRIYLPGRSKERYTKGPADGIVTDADAIAYRAAMLEERSSAPTTGFAADARLYLKHPMTTAMPSYSDREHQINWWIQQLGEMPREHVDKDVIDAKLQGLYDTGRYAKEGIQKYRTALMALFTRLDGEGERNPVKASRSWRNLRTDDRSQDYRLLLRILDAVPGEGRGLTIDRATLYREVWSEPVSTVAVRYDISGSRLARVCHDLKIPTPPPGYWAKAPEHRPARPALRPHASTGRTPETLTNKARLTVMFWTGMDPIQLQRLTEEHFSLGARWYRLPERHKGKGTRDDIKFTMTDEAAAAFDYFRRVNAWGAFSVSGLRRLWKRAQARVAREIRREDPEFRMPQIRLKDIRHSFGTEQYKATGDLKSVGFLMGHGPNSPMTKRYAKGAIEGVLKTRAAQFGAAMKTVLAEHHTTKAKRQRRAS